MDFQGWQAVMPLVLALLTLFVTWRYNTASLSHQRTQRLRELMHSGAWRTVHPMVLVMDVREAFNKRINLDPRALRLALDYQDHAFAALKDYLAAREFVRVSEDGSRFQRMAHGNSEKNYGKWSIYVGLFGFVPYTALMVTFFYLVDQKQPAAVLAILGAILSLLFSTKVALGLSTANRLFKLPPVKDLQDGLVQREPESLVGVQTTKNDRVIPEGQSISLTERVQID